MLWDRTGQGRAGEGGREGGEGRPETYGQCEESRVTPGPAQPRVTRYLCRVLSSSHTASCPSIVRGQPPTSQQSLMGGTIYCLANNYIAIGVFQPGNNRENNCGVTFQTMLFVLLWPLIKNRTG